jgi:hypothetical protein
VEGGYHVQSEGPISSICLERLRRAAKYDRLAKIRTGYLSNTNIECYCYTLQTRQSNNLYLPTSTLTLYQKGVYFTGIKLFNNLPLEIKEIVGIPKQFRISLRKYLITHCFYDLEEFYSVNE